MKVISRRENESFVIGEEAHITVLKICKDHVRLAIRSSNHTPCFWEQDLYLPENHSETSLPWWSHTFRGRNRFGDLQG